MISGVWLGVWERKNYGVLDSGSFCIKMWRQIDSTRRSHHETSGRLLRYDTLKAGGNGETNLNGQFVSLYPWLLADIWLRLARLLLT